MISAKNAPAAKVSIDSVLKKLNFIDRKTVADYINLEEDRIRIEHQLKLDEEIIQLRKLANKVWDAMDESLCLAMRENHISQERMDKIFTRLTELMKKTDAEKWINVDEIASHDFEIVQKDDIRDMVSELIECKCKGCIQSNKNCGAYIILKKYKIEPPTGFQRKCKYGC